MIMEHTYYVDQVGYELHYVKGERELSTTLPGELYHHFNGFRLLAVI